MPTSPHSWRSLFTPADLSSSLQLSRRPCSSLSSSSVVTPNPLNFLFIRVFLSSFLVLSLYFCRPLFKFLQLSLHPRWNFFNSLLRQTTGLLSLYSHQSLFIPDSFSLSSPLSLHNRESTFTRGVFRSFLSVSRHSW